MDTPIKTLVISNRIFVRNGMATWMASEPELQVVGEVTSGNEALSAIKNSKPDVVLIDLTLSDEIGIETIKQIENNGSKCKILALISSYEVQKILLAMMAGAIGFIQDDASKQEILNAIRMVIHDRAWISTDLFKAIIKCMPPFPLVFLMSKDLTKGEAKVAKLVVKGLSDAEIAATMHLKIGTVRFHLRNIYNKLKLKNRIQVALYFMQENSNQ